MSQEYYTIEKKNNLGNQFISTTVFHTIAVQIIEEMKGVEFEGGTMNMIPGTKGPLTVKINENNQVIIHAAIIVQYGLNINQIVNDIQNNIMNAIYEMMNFRNVRVNVDVKGVKF